MENDSLKKEPESTIPADCTSCRLIGGISLLLCSGYVLRKGQMAKFRSTKFLSIIFGSSLGYTGVARLMQWFPFDQELKSQLPS